MGLVLLLGVVVCFWPRKWYKPLVGTWGNKGGVEEQPLTKYDFDSLKKRGGISSEIKIGEVATEVEKRKEEKDNYQTRIFTFESEGKTISGTVNIPNMELSSLKKVVVMVRGFAETEGYYPGSGTWKAAQAFAREGYATFSIDFLGFGKSDQEATDILEARFVKVANVMDLIESIKALAWVDKDGIGIWAHSNGGQIVLSVLETLKGVYPTVLWAPMTNPFPQSVLETVEIDSPVRKKIEEFEKKYDTRRYAFENYYDWINSPILIQQGGKDEWCKVEWQEKVVGQLKNAGQKAELVFYPKSDHNLKGDWEEAVVRDIEFYREELN